jgi:hypothetical protein
MKAAMKSISDDDNKVPSRAFLDKIARRFQNYWFWKAKPTMERFATEEVLRQAGISFTCLKSRDEDPPDCEAIVDGHLVAIEVTEFIHQRTLEKSLKDQTKYYALWTQDLFVTKLNEIIHKKDNSNLKGGPYTRFIVLILSDETALYSSEVASWLQEISFETQQITDAFFVLSYEPSDRPEGGNCPTFRLNIRPAAA